MHGHLSVKYTDLIVQVMNTGPYSQWNTLETAKGDG